MGLVSIVTKVDTGMQKKVGALILTVAMLMQGLFVAEGVAAAKVSQVRIAYLTQQQKTPPVLSNLDVFISNKGEPGAELAIVENNTTGKFTGQAFVLDKFIVPENGDVLKVYNDKIAAKYALVILNLPTQALLAVSDVKTPQPHLLFDVATRDDALRNEQCRANVLHLLPSRAMRADALAQYMMKKRWHKVVSGHGQRVGRYVIC